MAENKPELQRGLEARHIELIALGGTIGVGLFMGAASTLKWAGPSVLLAYILAGVFVFFIMRSMGEMLFLEPVTGSRNSISPIERIIKKTKSPAIIYASRTEGPAHFSVLAAPINSPTPIVPPRAISSMCRASSPR